MNQLLALLFATSLSSMTKALVGGLGPSIRSLTALNLKPSEMTTILKLIAVKYTNGTPTYTTMGLLTPLDVQDIVEGITETFKALMTSYKITLTADQCSQVLTAVAARIAVRHPDPAVTPVV